MSKNKNLHEASKAKKDEFYTQLTDIEKEMKYYKEHFKDKVIFCNCDDPFESNFFKYFAMNFNHLGLKKLIATCYSGSPIIGEQLSLFDVKGLKIEGKTNRVPYKIEITEISDLNKDGSLDMVDIMYLLKNKNNVLTLLKEDGDFRSKECIELLKESDIVVTNPPFSLFREYVAQLMEYEKKFLIIGNINAITYKEFFPLLKDNKVWIGYGFNLSIVYKTPYPNLLESNKTFVVSKGFDPNEGYVKVPAICWYTNLDISKRHENLILYKRYNEEEHPKYDNYDAINVDKVADIPCDYDGVIGVPITFMDKYNPAQFKIVELSRYLKDCEGMKEEFVKTYYIQGGTGQITAGHPDLCYYDKNGKAIVPYMRILIQKINKEN